MKQLHDQCFVPALDTKGAFLMVHLPHPFILHLDSSLKINQTHQAPFYWHGFIFLNPLTHSNGFGRKYIPLNFFDPREKPLETPDRPLVPHASGP